MSVEVDRTGTVFSVTIDADGAHRVPYPPGYWIKPAGQPWTFAATDINSLPSGVKELAQANWDTELVAAFQAAADPT